MNRFAALDDSDNEEVKPSNVASKDKKKKVTTAAPAATPAAAVAAVTESKAPKKDGKKPSTPKPTGDAPASKPKAPADSAADAAATEGGEFEFTKGDGRDHNKKQRDSRRSPKDRLSAEDPSIKPDNRRRDPSHASKGGAKGRKGRDNKSESTDAVKENQAGENDAAAETVEETAEVAVVEEAVEPAEPEGPATLTLDEYYRQREEARAASAILSAAKAARIVEEDFKGLKVVGEGEEDAGVYTGVAKAKKEKSSSQRSTSKTVLVDLVFKGEEPAAASYEEYAPRGGDRDRRTGGRGGARGSSSGGGSPRNARGGAKIDIGDASAFPSL